jgi:predicted transcriptional regulator
MSMKTLTFEAPEEAIAVVDEIAAGQSASQADVLRQALDLYLADYASLKADLAEADRQIESGETISHEEVIAWFEDQHAHEAEAA